MGIGFGHSDGRRWRQGLPLSLLEVTTIGALILNWAALEHLVEALERRGPKYAPVNRKILIKNTDKSSLIV